MTLASLHQGEGKPKQICKYKQIRQFVTYVTIHLMKSITKAVEELINQDEIALESLRRGHLNLSAFACQIHSKVEDLTWKEVKVGSIVVALSRIAGTLDQDSSLRPKVRLDDISIRFPLCDVSFDKTVANQESVKQLLQTRMYQDTNLFFTITEGVSEITIIAPDSYYHQLVSLFNTKPKAAYRNLSGLSVRFSPKYLAEPNVIYVIIGELALEKVNVLEIVSTYTELAVLVAQEDAQKALSALGRLMG